jgi:hypothetical protein
VTFFGPVGEFMASDWFRDGEGEQGESKEGIEQLHSSSGIFQAKWW